jgi:dihydroorotate dehydrogenase (fumarate)
MNASGCHCTTENELDDLQNSILGAIVSKSSTIEPRTGNHPPRFHINQYGSLNSMGIPNHGYNFYLNYGMKSNKPFIQSIYPFNRLEVIKMLETINSHSQSVYIVEINISCPNLSNKILSNKDLLEIFLETINQVDTGNLLLGLKMPPIYDSLDYDQISDILLAHKNKIKFITCSNSIVNGLIIDYDKEETMIYPNNGMGGVGGIYCKPVCLSNVYNFYKRLKGEIEIIGCGGIANGMDVFEYILCGANAVQIGTQLLRTGLDCINTIENELIEIMTKKGYNNIDDYKGKITVTSAGDWTSVVENERHDL